MKTRKTNECYLVSWDVGFLSCMYFYDTRGGGNSKNSLPMTVSSTLMDEKTNGIIFGSMLSMGFFTIMYESGRKCWVSFMAILLLLIGIYGVILIEENEPIHYVFASMVFISIMTFMCWNITSKYLLALCILNFGLIFYLFGYILSNLFFFSAIENTFLFLVSEVIFIVVFAVFYLSLVR